MVKRLVLFAVILFATGCGFEALPTLVPTLAWPPPPTREEASPEEVFLLRVDGPPTGYPWTRPNVGTTVAIGVSFRPFLYHMFFDSDGSVHSAEMWPWEPQDGLEMRICSALDHPCELSGDWAPFSDGHVFPVDIDWLGPRDFFLTAQVRDASGKIIPLTEHPLAGVEDTVHVSKLIHSELPEGTPVGSLPLQVQTAAAATRIAFPVRGSVEFPGGGTSGLEGKEIHVPVSFQATSPAGTVEKMRIRVGRCFSEDEMAEIQWESFISQEPYSLPYTISAGSVLLNVQYLDSEGNLSPVFCVVLPVRGHPREFLHQPSQ
jgi:hypothetical protein